VDRPTRLAYSTGGEKDEDERAPEPRRGRVSLNLEHRGGDRVVTLVRGLAAAEAKSIGATLKSLLSTGGSVKGTTLELQGDHRERVAEWLRAHGRKRKGEA
jgi:translation initiation factor 1